MEIQTKELSVIKAQSTKALAIAKELKIRTQSGLDEAKEVLCKIAQAQKIVKLKKDGIVKPLNESLKKIRDLFSPIEDTMKEAEMMVKGKMLDYNEFLKKQEQEKTKKIELDVKSGKINIEQAGEKIEKIEEKRDSIPTMRIAKVLIDDESKIPDEYWVINLVKLNADVKSGKVVPGARLVYEETIKK